MQKLRNMLFLVVNEKTAYCVVKEPASGKKEEKEKKNFGKKQKAKNNRLFVKKNLKEDYDKMPKENVGTKQHIIVLLPITPLDKKIKTGLWIHWCDEKSTHIIDIVPCTVGMDIKEIKMNVEDFTFLADNYYFSNNVIVWLLEVLILEKNKTDVIDFLFNRFRKRMYTDGW